MDKGWVQLTDKKGGVYFKRTGSGERLDTPSEASCRERLIQLLETVDGDTRHPDVTRFWSERTDKMRTEQDPMKAAHALFIYNRLAMAWDELTNVPEPDIFGAFQPTDDWKPEPLTPEEESWFDRQPKSPSLTFDDFKQKALKVLDGKIIEAQKRVEAYEPEPEEDIFTAFNKE